MWSSTCETPLNTYVYCRLTGSVVMRSERIDGVDAFAVPVRRTFSAGLNRKSLRSPRTTTFALASTSSRRRTKSCSDARLAGALHGRRLPRELEAAVRVLVAALGVEVVGDHDHALATERE